MTNSRSLFMCIAAAMFMAACSEQRPATSTGTLGMALTATDGATTYRLSGTFVITGPDDLTVSPPPANETFNVDLPAGNYGIALQDGWTLSVSVNGGPYGPIDARLNGPASQAFTIFDGEIAHVRFSFQAGGGIIALGDGRLILEIGVDPVAQVDGCSITTSCGSAAITCSGATIDDACAFATGPEGTSLTCGDDVVTFQSGFGANPHGYGIAVRTLADLQGRLLDYYETHGQFPVHTAGLTPGASCCGANGASQCPANPSAWIGIPAWDALDFQIADAHAFVWAYTGTTGDTVSVVGRGDLDCDNITINYELVCAAVNGTPSCTIALPTICAPNDYE